MRFSLLVVVLISFFPAVSARIGQDGREMKEVVDVGASKTEGIEGQEYVSFRFVSLPSLMNFIFHN